jgi:hypothetical protein
MTTEERTIQTVTLDGPAAEALQERPSFSGPEAARITKITYRQLDLWCRTNTITPSIRAGSPGRGRSRRYSFDDLVLLTVVRELISISNRIDIAKRASSFLREKIGDAAATSTLLITGNDIKLMPLNATELLQFVATSRGLILALPLDGVLRQLHNAVMREGLRGIDTRIKEQMQ